MDSTLFQILQRLFEAEQELEKAREQIRALQATCTDLKQQVEAKDAVPAELH